MMQHTTMTGRTKFLSSIGERQVKVVASDGTPDRMGDILVPYGAELEEYRRNPIILAQHNAEKPIARCSDIHVESAAIIATIDFPPPGTSDISDRYLRLVKSGVLNSVSVGFLPLEMKPLRETGGWKYIRWELLEISCVSVPANPSALVIERGYRRDNVHYPAALSTLSFGGTYEMRKHQLEFHLRHSSEAEARRQRIARAYRALYPRS